MDGFYQMPIIHNDGYIPDNLTGFNYAKSTGDYQTTLHFFIDDYQYERLWNRPEEYLELLTKFDCVYYLQTLTYTWICRWP